MSLIQLDTSARAFSNIDSSPSDNLVPLKIPRVRLPGDPVATLSTHKSDPIVNELDIDHMVEAALQKGQVRNAALFVFGCNLGLRISDIVTLRYKDVFDDDWLIRKTMVVVEQKTGNVRTLYPNKAVKIAAKLMLVRRKHRNANLSPNEYIFVSESNRKAKLGSYTKGLRRESAWRIIKEMSEAAAVDGNIATHSMRKSFGHFVTERMPDRMSKTGDSVLLVQRLFNHSDVATTMRYIGMTDRDDAEAYRSLNLGLQPLLRYVEREGYDG